MHIYIYTLTNTESKSAIIVSMFATAAVLNESTEESEDVC